MRAAGNRSGARRLRQWREARRTDRRRRQRAAPRVRCPPHRVRSPLACRPGRPIPERPSNMVALRVRQPGPMRARPSTLRLDASGRQVDRDGSWTSQPLYVGERATETWLCSYDTRPADDDVDTHARYVGTPQARHPAGRLGPVRSRLTSGRDRRPTNFVRRASCPPSLIVLPHSRCRRPARCRRPRRPSAGPIAARASHCRRIQPQRSLFAPLDPELDHLHQPCPAAFYCVPSVDLRRTPASSTDPALASVRPLEFVWLPNGVGLATAHPLTRLRRRSTMTLRTPAPPPGVARTPASRHGTPPGGTRTDRREDTGPSNTAAGQSTRRRRRRRWLTYRPATPPLRVVSPVPPQPRLR